MMYKSPIEIIYSSIEAQMENEIYKEVIKCGINVDTEELVKKAINEIGEERLKKYVFRVEE